MATWNPALYLSFADQRTRPAAELLTPTQLLEPKRVIDLGCGPGNSTALLAARWSKAELEGLDSSAAMLEEAGASGVLARWTLADIAAWTPAAPYDVIFSNATLQWLDGQDVRLPRLMSYVRPGGVFAFQVPANINTPSHVLMREVADSPRWAARLKTVRGIVSGSTRSYYEMLAADAASLNIWETEYLQVLEGEDPIYRWVSATGLKPFLDALADDEHEEFIVQYKTRLNCAYPRRTDGKTLFPFRRLFVVALRR